MFARMTIIQGRPESTPDAIRIFRKSVLPETKKQRGYRGACLLTDAKSGKGIAVTFWRTERDAIANEDSLYYQEQLVKFQGILAGAMIREGYEVSIHALGRPEPAKPRAKVRRKT